MDYHELVAKYVGLWSVLEAPEAQRYAMQAFLGIKYLVNGRLGTSQAIYEEIEFHTSTPAALSYVMRGIAVFLRSLALISIRLFHFKPDAGDRDDKRSTDAGSFISSSFDAC
jgi:hypothetical protein